MPEVGAEVAVSRDKPRGPLVVQYGPPEFPFLEIAVPQVIVEVAAS